MVFATALLASPALAAPPSVDAAKMMGRWYEIARVPNSLQRGCQGGASDWTRSGDGFSVVQTCHKGGPDGPLATWKAKARAADPSNTRFRMTFFGGLVSQDYQVLDRKDSDGWLILATHDGRYMWLNVAAPDPAGADPGAGDEPHQAARLRPRPSGVAGARAGLIPVLRPERRRNNVAAMDVTVVTVSRPETTASVTRGAARLLVALGYAPLTEVTLPNGRRADLMALGRKGEIFIVEVKSGLDDFRYDQKWHE